MARGNTSIIINGKHYDALTGTLLHSSPGAKSIDGVVSGSKKAVATPTIPQPITVNPIPAAAVRKPIPKKPRLVSDITRTPATRAKTHHIKPSKTLMRHTVKKPTTASLKRHGKVQGSTLATVTHAKPSQLDVPKKLSVTTINHRRTARAAQTTMSPRIAHFAHQIERSAAVVLSEVQETVHAIDKAIVIPPTSLPSQRYRADITPARIQRSASSDIFEKALLRATSHEEPAPVVRSKKNRRFSRILRRRMVSYSAGAFAVLAIVGVFGVQHAETIQFKVATNGANFSVSRPDYTPAGYNITNIKSANGYVGFTYAADTISGKHRFALTQKPSNWNNQTLLHNITETNDYYQEVEQAGRTVYVYGRNQAAWVSNGVLYQIAGNSTLSSNEFGKIAASL